VTLEIEDVAAIKWSRKVEVGEQAARAAGASWRVRAARSANEASARFYRSGLSKLEDALAAVAPQRGNQRIISAVGFDILIQHTPLARRPSSREDTRVAGTSATPTTTRKARTPTRSK
jgi:hypothetical protein